MFALSEAGIQVVRLLPTPRFGCASRGVNHIGPLRGPAPYPGLTVWHLFEVLTWTTVCDLTEIFTWTTVCDLTEVSLGLAPIMYIDM
jgi:hypothetical protein